MTIQTRQAFTPMIQQCGLVNDICKPLFDASALTHFSFVEMNEDGEFIAICNNSHKYNLLIEHNVATTISTDILQREQLGVIIADLEGKDFYNEQIKAAFSYFNEAHFMQVLEKSERNGCPVLRFYMYGTHHSNNQINHFYVNHLDMFKEFNNYFVNRMNSFFENVERVKVPQVLSHQFKAMSTKLRASEVDNTELFGFLPQKQSRKIITKREKQVIDQYMKGLTATEIANELHISYRTVERHLDNIRGKLNCRSRRQIFSKLLELGYDINSIAS